MATFKLALTYTDKAEAVVTKCSDVARFGIYRRLVVTNSRAGEMFGIYVVTKYVVNDRFGVYTKSHATNSLRVLQLAAHGVHPA